MSSETGVSIVLCTCPPAEAERLARFVVETRRAACVNIVPGVTSVYRWQGAVEKDDESLLVIKCPRERVDALRDALAKEHPYEVPEVLALPVEAGNPPYLDWVLEAVRAES